MRATEAIIRSGYGIRPGDPTGVMFFRVEIGRQDVDGIRLVESYNNFVGDDVADAVAGILEDRASYLIAFGREYSPVLYIQPRPGQTEGIVGILRDLSPDELDVTAEGIRAWWD